jgi:hypothetical protein
MSGNGTVSFSFEDFSRVNETLSIKDKYFSTFDMKTEVYFDQKS